MERSRILRIVDANLNRAREALRALEEVCRLGRDDAVPAARLKSLRHRLATFETSLQLRPSDLPLARDAEGDVGRAAPSTPYASLEDLVRANAHRFEEAARVLEEFARLMGADPTPIARCRFEAYTLEKELLPAVGLRARLARARLYVVLNAGPGDPDPRTVAAAALRGGADILQIRAFHGPDRASLDLVRDLAAACRDAQALFVVNDRPDLAAAADADGVHVGEDDLPAAAARRVVGPGRLVGFSFHPPDGLPAPPEADYVGIGTVFPSPLKPERTPVGPDEAAARFRASPVPAFPIGGITAANVGELIARGCFRAAVSSAVARAADPEGAARALKDALDAAPR